ncbi:ABC transporter substrate-binding protein [Chloroflexota bacterium]
MNLKRVIGFIVPLILILFTTMSCNTAVKVAGEISDSLGRTITFDSIPQRIVSTAPSSTEILFALGLGDKVVGVSNLCDYPVEVTTKYSKDDGTMVGDAFGMNLEAMIALNPDFVLGFGYNQLDWVLKLETQGIPVVILAPNNIDDLLSDIELIGKITGVEETAKELTVDMRAELDDISTKVKAKTAEGVRPTVLFETGYWNGIWTTGAGSFVSNLIYLAGGTDIGISVSSGNPLISMEYISEQDPDLIILGDSPWETKESVIARGGAWLELTAVDQGKIYDIDADLYSRNGPRVVDGIKALVSIIHPDIEMEI